MIRSWLNLIFPPLCLACKERSATQFLCPACWHLCALPDPVGRCRHCFEELDQRGNLCTTCRKEPHLSAVRAYVFDPESPAFRLGSEAIEAMAGFAYLQWVELEWPHPDAVIPMPGDEAIAQQLAEWIEAPCIKALGMGCEYREDLLEEEGELLLFDRSNPSPLLEKATLALAEAFPERVRLLSLFPVL